MFAFTATLCRRKSTQKNAPQGLDTSASRDRFAVPMKRSLPESTDMVPGTA